MVGLGILINAYVPTLLTQVFFLDEEQEKRSVVHRRFPQRLSDVSGIPISVGVANVLDFKTSLIRPRDH